MAERNEKLIATGVGATGVGAVVGGLPVGWRAARPPERPWAA